MRFNQELISTVAAAGPMLGALPLTAQGGANTDHFKSELESRVLVQLIADPELPVGGISAQGSAMRSR